MIGVSPLPDGVLTVDSLTGGGGEILWSQKYKFFHRSTYDILKLFSYTQYNVYV